MAKAQRTPVEFFDHSGEDYARAYSAETPAGFALRIRRQKVLELFDKPGGKVLDVGCGPAPMTEELLKRGCQFWGADPSQKMIEICRRHYGEAENTHFLMASATELPFPAEFFDAVLCIGVTDSLPDPKTAIHKLLEVLKPAGTLIVSFSNRRSPYAWWKVFVFYPAVAILRRIFPTSGGHDRPSRYPNLFSLREAHALFAGGSAQVETVVPYYYNVLLSPLDEIWPRAALWLTQKLEKRESTLPWMSAGFLFRVRKAPNVREDQPSGQ